MIKVNVKLAAGLYILRNIIIIATEDRFHKLRVECFCSSFFLLPSIIFLFFLHNRFAERRGISMLAHLDSRAGVTETVPPSPLETRIIIIILILVVVYSIIITRLFNYIWTFTNHCVLRETQWPCGFYHEKMGRDRART